MNAVRSASVLAGNALAPELIDLCRDDLKMPGIDAVADPAEMIDLAISRNGIAKRAVEPAMRESGPRIWRGVENAVPA